ncbi:hypothetical protein [Paenibacillus sp. DYY-L-2]|uniref:hypothetical protein n=1 Tax=Paenibacillus sp. DYY-L-2 TaxID=3447013 RepID=UPI003F4FE426
MAIGLQFICETFGIEYKELALKMETSPQNINAWLREKRKIPPMRLDQLTKIFPKIPKGFFGRELFPSEKTLVQEIFFELTDEYEVVEYEDEDDEGNKYIRSEVVRQHDGIINYLREKHDKQLLIERYQSLIFDEGGDFNVNEKLLQMFANLLQHGSEDKQYQLLKMLFYYLQPYDSDFGFGSDPYLEPSKKQEDMYGDFEQFLRKYNFFNFEEDYKNE